MQNYTKTLLALRGKKYALIVLSLLSLSIFIWTMIVIFATQLETSVEKKVKTATIPLKPFFNTEILAKMSEKKHFTVEELTNFKVRVFEYDQDSREKRLQIIEK